MSPDELCDKFRSSFLPTFESRLNLRDLGLLVCYFLSLNLRLVTLLADLPTVVPGRGGILALDSRRVKQPDWRSGTRNFMFWMDSRMLFEFSLRAEDGRIDFIAHLADRFSIFSIDFCSCLFYISSWLIRSFVSINDIDLHFLGGETAVLYF
jgi:hypothetical protein